MRRVACIALKKFAPPDEFFMPVDQVVNGYGVMAFLPERFTAMGADIPGTAGHQYVHGITFISD